MNRRSLIGLLLGVALWTTVAAAQDLGVPIVEITYEEALALARQKAPEVMTARARAREAGSQLEAASVWRFNPQLSGTVGPRFDTAGTTVDWSLGAQQWIEIGDQRSARVEAARAAAMAGEARSEETRRRILRDVAVTFIAALYWKRRVTLAEENLRLVEAVARVAAKRHEAGDVGGLERSVSALAVVRAGSDKDRSAASLARVAGQLKRLLGFGASAELVCRGDLRQLGLPVEVSDDPGDRADLRALRADIRQAEAQVALGRAGRVPNLALGAGYSREESTSIVKGTLTVELPIFDHGQGSGAAAKARRDRLRAELDATGNAVSLEINTARTTVQALGAAVRRFEANGLNTLDQAERLAAASYESGAIPLGELLAVRRELVQAKLDYLELLLGAANARAELTASTGTFR